MSRSAKSGDIEGLVIVLDVGSSMSTKQDSTSCSYLQTSSDIVQMIIQRKMFQASKDEIGLVLCGTRETDNILYDNDSDQYSHISLVRPLDVVDWKLIEFIQNEISATNLQADIIDGLLVATNHFRESSNKFKLFEKKRVLILTDFSSASNFYENSDLISIRQGLEKSKIIVDIITPFDDKDEDDGGKNNDANDSANNRPQNNSKKPMTAQQRSNRETLCKILNTEGEDSLNSIYSFEEALSCVSMYQAKATRSTGTKFQLSIGENFRLPVVSMIKCTENKPILFKFKKVYAKDETVELKLDRARFTKDDEQRDLDDKTDCVDAYKYGSTFM
jgi:ATP-dependent DNA helicase 2 subunit 2